MHRLLFLMGLLVWLTPQMALAQAPSLMPEKPPPVWLSRAQTETQQLAELALGYPQFDRANLYAQLGEFWWPLEEARGREWLRKAVDIVAFIPLQETAAERQLHIRAIRPVLRRVGKRDGQLAQRLSEALQTLTRHQIEAGQGKDAGNELLTTAFLLAYQDPGRAKELALSGLQAGSSEGGIRNVLISLRIKDAQLADALFTEVLALARARLNDELLLVLVFLTTKMEEQLDNLPRTPEPLRLQALKAVIERLLIPPNTADEQTRYCRFVAKTVVWQRERLLQLFPAYTSQVQQALQVCQNSFSRDSLEGRALSKAVAGDKLPDNLSDLIEGRPETVADKLALARKTAEPKSRTQLLWAAAQQAADGDDPDEAVRILEGMTAEERELARYWGNNRGSFAAQAAQKYLKQKDYGQARKVMEAVPSNLATAAVIECLSEAGRRGYVVDLGNLVSGKAGEPKMKFDETERDILVEWLNLARKRLADARTDTPADQGETFLILVNLYAVVQPVDALSALNEVVRALNRSVAKEQERQAKAKPAAGDNAELRSLPPQRLLGSLIKESFDGIRVALNDLEDEDTKTRLHLGLLQTALGFHQEELEAKRKEEAERAKRKKDALAKP
jgi:hypothetical protein